MREQREQWSVRKCATTCGECEKTFVHEQIVVSELQFQDGGYLRVDRCDACAVKSSDGISVWKTQFLLPPVEEELIPKENLESLLRKRMQAEQPEDRDLIFILAVMLERKRILVERGVQLLADGFKLRVYEHRKTKESFIVTDPGLRLDELETVQDEVAILLGGQPRSRPAAEVDASGS
jgi:hypothetical protein